MSRGYEPRVSHTSKPRPRYQAGDATGSKRITNVLIVIAAIIAIILLGLVGYQWVYSDRIHEGVTAFSVDIGGKSQAEASALLSDKLNSYAQQPLVLRHGDREWTTSLQELGLSMNVDKVVNQAFAIGRTGNPFERLGTQMSAMTGARTEIKPEFTIDERQRIAYFASLSRQIDQPVRDAALTIDKAELQVAFTNSQLGLHLDVDKSLAVLEQAVANQSSNSIELVVEKTEPARVEADVELAREQANKMLSKAVLLTFEEQSWEITPQQLAPWIVFKPKDNEATQLVATLANEPARVYFEGLARKLDRPAINARFNYDENSKTLSLLRQSVEGAKLDVQAAIAQLNERATSDKRTMQLPVTISAPLIKAEDMGSLVIKDLIQEASTSYAGSVAERAHNVELAASRLNGVVVAPGQIFSFNDEIGPVTLESGFRVGWGITVVGTEMVTVPSEGGGICQVATTLFHPAFWAGYPIVERVGHLYWIPRYGAPPKGLKGLDATVDQIFDTDGNVTYEVDLRFENNTDDAILIQSRTDGNNLSFALYGVKPDWEVKVTEPLIEDVVPANTAVVTQEDPTMPAGTKIMVEEARDGFKSTIKRQVLRDGQVIHEQEITSRYRPSRNVYVVGTKSSTPPPEETGKPAEGEEEAEP